MNIDSYKQNKPSYIVGDIMISIGCVNRNLIYEILLNRGVFKWLSVRRKLITLKNLWKDRVKEHSELKKSARRWNNLSIKNHLFIYEKGYLDALEQCRKEVRRLCHSPRFQVQDNDSEAREFLNTYKGENDDREGL